MRTRRIATAIVLCLLTTVACTASNSGGNSADTISSPTTSTLAPTTTADANTTEPPPSASAPPSPSRSSSASSSPPATPSPRIQANGGPAAASLDITGAWTGSYQSATSAGPQVYFTVTFVPTGSDITGSIMIAGHCVNRGTITGQLDGTRITFGAIKAAETITFDGTLAADSMTGKYQFGAGCGDDSGTWTATRR